MKSMLLTFNAFAILNEQRFLDKYGLGQGAVNSVRARRARAVSVVTATQHARVPLVVLVFGDIRQDGVPERAGLRTSSWCPTPSFAHGGASPRPAFPRPRPSVIFQRTVKFAVKHVQAKSGGYLFPHLVPSGGALFWEGVLHASHGPKTRRQAKGRLPRATTIPPGPISTTRRTHHLPNPSPTPPRNAPMPTTDRPPHPVRSGWREPSASPRRAPSAAGIATPSTASTTRARRGT